MNGTIETIIFDCGRVITMDQDRGKAVEMAALLDSHEFDFSRAYTEERLDYDRGTISAGEYWTHVAARLGASVSAELIERLVRLDMDSWFTINPDTVRLLDELKTSGYRLLMLSNMNIEGKERMYGAGRICGTTDWVGLFDEVLLSCDLGSLKPEMKIYEQCLARAGVPARKCLFIDDIPINVDSARKCGINAVLFVDAHSLRSHLEMEYSIGEVR
jgi:putative hydrolase of the HAD superfamily